MCQTSWSSKLPDAGLSFPSLFLPLLLVQPLHHPLLPRCRCVPPRRSAHAPSSKRDVWVYISRARVYRTPTMYVCTREWRYSYAIRFRAKRKRSCSKRRGVFTISLETRRNLEKGTVPNHWETSYPLVASLSFRISSAFSKSGEEEVVKDLVSCSINIYNRASYPISSVLYKYFAWADRFAL